MTFNPYDKRRPVGVARPSLREPPQAETPTEITPIASYVVLAKPKKRKYTTSAKVLRNIERITKLPRTKEQGQRGIKGLPLTPERIRAHYSAMGKLSVMARRKKRDEAAANQMDGSAGKGNGKPVASRKKRKRNRKANELGIAKR